MKKRFWIGLALVLVIPGLMFTASCARVECGPAWAPDVKAKPVVAEEPKAEVVEEEPLPEVRAEPEPAEVPAKEEFPKVDIYFEYDSSALTPESQDNLRDNAKWLEENPDASVIIEGHCDERGSNEYNMALGDRRAKSVKTFLVDLGTAAQRITTISYGEEKPVDPGHDETAWAKNRRAHFVIE
jgi:peptidoglycan-associated lipoprotein